MNQWPNYTRSGFLATLDKYLVNNCSVIKALFMAFTVTAGAIGRGGGAVLYAATSSHRF